MTHSYIPPQSPVTGVNTKFQNIIRLFKQRDWIKRSSLPKLKNHDLSYDNWPDWSGTVTSEDAFPLYRAGLTYGIPSLVKFASTILIAEKILHRSSSVAFLDRTKYSELMQGSWRNLTEKGGCRCTHCARSAPRVLLFSLEEDIKDREMEHVARQTLVSAFGLGWCTSEFASLPQDISQSVLVDLLKMVTPQNALPLLFAAEEALRTLDQSLQALPMIRRSLLTARVTIEDLIWEEPELCFETPEWKEIVDVCRLSEVPSQEILDKLRWISDAISRAGQGKVSQESKTCYLDRLRLLLSELLPTEIDSNTSLPSMPDDDIQDPIVQSAINLLAVDAPTDIVSVRPLPSLKDHVIQDPIAQSTEESPPVDAAPSHPPVAIARFMKSENLKPNYSSWCAQSSVCSTQGLPSVLCSRASSRTASTDYGLFYTQLGLSPPESLLERPISHLSTTKKNIPAISRFLSRTIKKFKVSSPKSPSSMFLKSTQDESSRIDSFVEPEASESASLDGSYYRPNAFRKSSFPSYHAPSVTSSYPIDPTTTSLSGQPEPPHFYSVEPTPVLSPTPEPLERPPPAYTPNPPQPSQSHSSSGTSQGANVAGEGFDPVATSAERDFQDRLGWPAEGGFFSTYTRTEEDEDGYIDDNALRIVPFQDETHYNDDKGLHKSRINEQELQQKITEIESTVRLLVEELAQRDAKLAIVSERLDGYEKRLEVIKQEKKQEEKIPESDELDALMGDVFSEFAKYPWEDKTPQKIPNEKEDCSPEATEQPEARQSFISILDKKVSLEPCLAIDSESVMETPEEQVLEPEATLVQENSSGIQQIIDILENMSVTEGALFQENSLTSELVVDTNARPHDLEGIISKDSSRREARNALKDVYEPEATLVHEHHKRSSIYKESWIRRETMQHLEQELKRLKGEIERMEGKLEGGDMRYPLETSAEENVGCLKTNLEGHLTLSHPTGHTDRATRKNSSPNISALASGEDDEMETNTGTGLDKLLYHLDRFENRLNTWHTKAQSKALEQALLAVLKHNPKRRTPIFTRWRDDSDRVAYGKTMLRTGSTGMKWRSKCAVDRWS